MKLKFIFKYLFFFLIIRPIVNIIVGLNIRHYLKLPKEGPAIIIANHNSHLDTVALMCLFPLSQLGIIRPVAAADYWVKNKLIGWFALNCIGIIPLDRKPANKEAVFEHVNKALRDKEIVIIFPEGSRGKAEEMSEFKKGICHLSAQNPDVPVVPIFLYGMGKSMPKGEKIFVPFVCDVNIGDSLKWNHDIDKFHALVKQEILRLAEETPSWIRSQDNFHF